MGARAYKFKLTPAEVVEATDEYLDLCNKRRWSPTNNFDIMCQVLSGWGMLTRTEQNAGAMQIAEELMRRDADQIDREQERQRPYYSIGPDNDH